MREEIIVVGGGPSGLQFAREIGHRTDWDVTVLERNSAIGDNTKSTGGTFDEMVLQYDVPDSVIMGATDEIVFESDNEQVSINVPGYVLDFPAFLEWMAEDASDHGAEIVTGVNVQDALMDNGQVTGVRDNKGKEWDADLVIDASGPAGVLSEDILGWDRDPNDRAVGKEYEVTGNWDGDGMVFRWGHDVAPGGYAWTFRAGDRFKIGVCWCDYHFERFSDTDETIDDYIQRWIDDDPRWEVDEIHEVHAGEAYVDTSMNKRVTDGLMAVGDSIGSINPVLGEGIRPGMDSARMAAERAIPAMKMDDVSEDALKNYETRWNAEKGSRWRMDRFIAEILYGLQPDQYDELFGKMSDWSEDEWEDLLSNGLNLLETMKIYPFRLQDIKRLPRWVRVMA